MPGIVGNGSQPLSRPLLSIQVTWCFSSQVLSGRAERDSGFQYNFRLMHLTAASPHPHPQPPCREGARATSTIRVDGVDGVDGSRRSLAVWGRLDF